MTPHEVPLDTTPAGRGRGSSCWVGMDVQASYVVSTDTARKSSSYQLSGMKVPYSYLAFADTKPVSIPLLPVPLLQTCHTLTHGLPSLSSAFLYSGDFRMSCYSLSKVEA